MVRPSPQRVLIIGDSQRQLQSAIAQAIPGAHVTSVSTVFDGIGELSVNTYTTILAAAEPIERRPEPAVRMLRQLAGDGKLVLFGHPTLEILSRKMLQFGCDDYIITPAKSGELQQLFETPSLRLTSGESAETNGSSTHSASTAPQAGPSEAPEPMPEAAQPTMPITPPASVPVSDQNLTQVSDIGDPDNKGDEKAAANFESAPGSSPKPKGMETAELETGLEFEPESPEPSQAAAASTPAPPQALPELPFADIFLDALLQSPHDAPQAAVRMLNVRLAPHVELRLVSPKAPPIEIPVGCHVYSHAVLAGTADAGTLHLFAFSGDDNTEVQGILAQLAHLIGKVASLKQRSSRLQKLSITDDLTGIYNARYFKHFLTRLIERAKNERFNVTLLLFDIDDFKKYNDLYGHGAGDEILKQTARLMRRCCREHDLVARIGGDEFAVVFWDKEGPRQPLDPSKAAAVSRAPQTPVQMFERFKRLAAGSDFAGLGQSGRGKLSVSGGLAVYPYDARDVPSLIKAADDYLMFKAKKAGKNSVYLVEGKENGGPKTE
ncbi:MAG TPA: diguanylate cyclase [Tepidisphaeraceae bacterium]|nr:diguanylate cyclase [Tepidisphaeraceae bacterium]